MLKIYLILLFLVSTVTQVFTQPPEHNCRMWGMVTSGNFDQARIRTSLDSLQVLSASNPTGWGIGFYTETVRGNEIPVIYRGMWRADMDTQFDTAAEVLISNISNSGIAHVRKASSGYVNIPDPHPFYTKSLTRDFDMMLAHNGTLTVQVLKDLLGSYTSHNHYHYAMDGDVNEPNHDTDLYRLYLMKWIDEHPGDCITKCLFDAMNNLIDQMGYNPSYNFILISKGDTLWAVRYNNSLVYRKTTNLFNNTWEVASEALEGSGWTTATNHSLFVFSPNSVKPDEYALITNNSIDDTLSGDNPPHFNVHYNPSDQSLSGEFEHNDRQRVVIRLFDLRGIAVAEVFDDIVNPGFTPFSCYIGHLPAGMYAVEKLTPSKTHQVSKIIKD